MFEAGRRSLFAFSSNRTRPVSSEETLIPTIAADKSGLASMSEMRERNSARLFVGSAFNEGAGNDCGLATGVGLGDAVVCGVAGVCTCRSRWVAETTLAGPVNRHSRTRIKAILDCGFRLFIFIKTMNNWPESNKPVWPLVFDLWPLTFVVKSKNEGKRSKAKGQRPKAKLNSSVLVLPSCRGFRTA